MGVNIFDGVRDKNMKFEYVDPDHLRYQKKDNLIFNKKEVPMPKQADNVDWECEFCSIRNSKYAKVCKICYTESFKERYAKFMSVVDENNTIANTKSTQQQMAVCNAENDGKPKWNCKLCTFTNTGSDTDTCEMCGQVDKEREAMIDSLFDDDGKNGFFGDYVVKPNKNANNEKKEAPINYI